MNLAVRIQLVGSCYTQAVRARLGSPYWRIPDSFKQHLRSVAERAQELNIPIKAYIKMQFESMPKEWCLRKIKIVYPPLAMLGTERAYQRAHQEAEERNLEKE